MGRRPGATTRTHPVGARGPDGRAGRCRWQVAIFEADQTCVGLQRALVFELVDDIVLYFGDWRLAVDEVVVKDLLEGN